MYDVLLNSVLFEEMRDAVLAVIGLLVGLTIVVGGGRLVHMAVVRGVYGQCDDCTISAGAFDSLAHKAYSEGTLSFEDAFNFSDTDKQLWQEEQLGSGTDQDWETLKLAKWMEVHGEGYNVHDAQDQVMGMQPRTSSYWSR